MRTLTTYILWPVLLGGAIAANYFGLRTADPVLWFNASYIGLAGLLFAFERLMPHERRWLQSDRQLLADIGHTLISKSAVQILIVVLAVMGLAESGDFSGAAWWPRAWPLPLQIVLGLVIAECGFYWAHRLSHELPMLWRFHAVHHSVTRLWIVNTGRFHFVNTLVSVAFGLTVGLVVGVPDKIIVWVSAITAYVGLLTHCNVEMRCGVFNYLFNTPNLHRWHHSMAPGEGNRNYGENLVFLDQLFGTFVNFKRRPPAEIGIDEEMPASLGQQILHPFRHRAASGAAQPEMSGSA